MIQLQLNFWYFLRPSEIFQKNHIHDFHYWTDKGMVWSDMSKPALIFFPPCKSTHIKIHCQNFSCWYALQVFFKNCQSYSFFLYAELLVPEVCTTLTTAVTRRSSLTLEIKYERLHYSTRECLRILFRWKTWNDTELSESILSDNFLKNFFHCWKNSLSSCWITLVVPGKFS
jgi:hypothetical protein